MIFKITAKNLNISHNIRREIEKKVDKISKLLPHLVDDLTAFNINIKSHKSNFYKRSLKTKLSSELSNFVYRIKLALPLPGDYLMVRVNNQTLGGAIKTAFGKLTEQVKHYRERHFKSLSRYPNRSSIRRGEEIWMQGLNWQ